jgi:hypothetical protein
MVSDVQWGKARFKFTPISLARLSSAAGDKGLNAPTPRLIRKIIPIKLESYSTTIDIEKKISSSNEEPKITYYKR